MQDMQGKMEIVTNKTFISELFNWEMQLWNTDTFGQTNYLPAFNKSKMITF